jgi:hypothetical protein
MDNEGPLGGLLRVLGPREVRVNLQFSNKEEACRFQPLQNALDECCVEMDRFLRTIRKSLELKCPRPLSRIGNLVSIIRFLLECKSARLCSAYTYAFLTTLKRVKIDDLLLSSPALSEHKPGIE